jgi:hypothetical protein
MHSMRVGGPRFARGCGLGRGPRVRRDVEGGVGVPWPGDVGVTIWAFVRAMV